MSDEIKPEDSKTEDTISDKQIEEPLNENHDDEAKAEKEQPQGESEIPYKPTSIVLAKVKGYPPWPAMVVEESLLPEQIRKMKPKSVKGSKKKQRRPIVILPVRFFSDDTYIWIKSNEIKTLNEEMIEKYFSNERRRKDHQLDRAYTLARSPPEMELFVKWGSRGKPPKLETVENEDLEELANDDDDLELGEEESVSSEDQNEYEEQPRKRQKKDKKASTKNKKKSKATKESKVSAEKVEEDDSDWGLDEVNRCNYSEGDYIFEDKHEQSDFEKTFPSAEELLSETNEFHNQFDHLDVELSSQLLNDPIDTKEVLKGIARLKKLTLPKSIFVKSKLLKAFIVIMRKTPESFPYPQIKSQIKDILSSWVDLNVDENPLVPETPEASSDVNLAEAEAESEYSVTKVPNTPSDSKKEITENGTDNDKKDTSTNNNGNMAISA